MWLLVLFDYCLLRPFCVLPRIDPPVVEEKKHAEGAGKRNQKKKGDNKNSQAHPQKGSSSSSVFIFILILSLLVIAAAVVLFMKRADVLPLVEKVVALVKAQIAKLR
jgi:hypothetical protein